MFCSILFYTMGWKQYELQIILEKICAYMITFILIWSVLF